MGGSGPGTGAAASGGHGDAWYFTREQLAASASRRCGLDTDKELSYRQQAANLIQDMGQRLQVYSSQLCINTAIVYMHRFYVFHSFTHFHRNAIAAAALFLAAKVEEQPRKLEYVIKVAHVCLHRGESAAGLDQRSEHYQEQAQDLVFNENVLLQTLGFDVAIDHPHTHVVRTCHLIKATKDLAQTSYFMASNSLHLTTMCLQFRPTVVACFCIHLASKWSNWEIPESNEGRPWFSYVDRTVTGDQLEKLTSEFLCIFEKCPSRLKRKMMSMSNSGGSPHSGMPQAGTSSQQQAVSPFDVKSKFITDDMEKSFDKEYEREKRRMGLATSGGYVAVQAQAQVPQTQQPTPQKMDFREYREKREREERERRQQQALQQQQQQPRPAPPQQQAARPGAPHHHHKPPNHHKPTNHHKPHPWPHHKPPHDQRHHRPPPQQQQHQQQQQQQQQQPAQQQQVKVISMEQPQAQQSAPPSQPPQEQRAEPPPPQRTRPPSLFSPENATAPSAAAAAPRRPHPPQQRRPPSTQQTITQTPSTPTPLLPTPPPEQHQIQQPPRKRPVDPAAAVVREMQPPAVVSPLTSPTIPSPQSQRSRPRSSSSSEPELVPVMKKIDETPGYENVIRDSQRGNAIRARVDRPTEQRRQPSPPRPINGIETDPAMVSNLLKESLVRPVTITPPAERHIRPSAAARVPHPAPVEVRLSQPAQAAPAEPAPVAPTVAAPPVEATAAEHRHRSDKKKKKEKHKHKDREKPREERKKHKKDKDRDRKRESEPPVAEAPPVADPNASGALRITIPRDKLATSPGLKIKIPKERLSAPPPNPPSVPRLPPPAAHQAAWQPPPAGVSGLKIKIPKEVLETSRKRAAMDPNAAAGPPPKMYRHNNGMQHKVEGAAGSGGHAHANGHASK